MAPASVLKTPGAVQPLGSFIRSDCLGSHPSLPPPATSQLTGSVCSDTPSSEQR